MRNYFIYHQTTYTEDVISAGNIYLATSLAGTSLEVSTYEVDVESDTKALLDFQRNDPLVYFHRGRQMGIFYVQHVERVGTKTYHISATSALGLLDQWDHQGGIYTGQTLEEVLPSICGSVPYIIKDNLRGIKLYGWLPIAKARQNLSQVLFAVGAWVKTDLDGILRIEPLWDGWSGAVVEDKMYEEGSVVYVPPVSSVSVTEHQYMEGGEEATLFEGVTQAGDIITFAEPMYALSSTGFTILESNANYARVSAGTGTLTGRKYIHNTRQVARSVTNARSGDSENVRTVTDATLVSLVNSASVAERMDNYYRCVETISNDIVLDHQSPGGVVSAYHPYDKTEVPACIESLDINVSGTLKAQAKLLVGFTPMQMEDMEYFDTREVLTGSGSWTPPEGVTEVHYVLFSGAQGGGAGLKGGDSSGSGSYQYVNGSSITQDKVISTVSFTLWGNGGVGGVGGPGGKGSRILEGNLTLSPSAAVSYSCGPGGLGADYNAEGAVSGSNGADTIFGGATTASGAQEMPAGWQDPFTKEVFATSGPQGLPGGEGAGAIPGYTIPDKSKNEEDILRYNPSSGAYDEDGNLWAGAPTKESAPGVAWTKQWITGYGAAALAGYALGPGGVAGVTQQEPSAIGTFQFTQKKVTATSVGGQTPPAPSLIPRKSGLTVGGRGGYGGGGASAQSWGGVEVRPEGPSASVVAGPVGVGGPGGKGAPGGDGMIILFYAKPKKFSSGAFLTQDGRFFLDGLGRFFVG